MALQLLLKIFDAIVAPKRARKSSLAPFAKKRAVRRAATRSDPELANRWHALRADYFPTQPEIDDYHVAWSSRRQKRVLACCHLRKREVRVARELQEVQAAEWLDPILYHEMCHAALGLSLTKRRGKIPWHGREFKALVCRHPGTTPLERWIKEGGWSALVRRDRARRAAHARRTR